MSRALLPTLLALPLGYLLGWLLFGLPGWAVLIAVLVAALALAAGVGDGRGVAGFVRLLTLLLLAAGMLWLLGGGLLLVGMVLSPYNPLPLGVGGLLVVLGVGLVTFLLLGGLVRRLARTPGSPLRASPGAPFLLGAGVLLFAFLPAVRVDCRGLQADSFLSYGSGFSGPSASQSYWARKPGLIPDRAELPGGFVVDGVSASVTRCFQDGQGRPRPLTLRASEPLLVVHLTERVRPGMRAYAAVFTPGEHRKLTPWLPAEPPYGQTRTHKPYFWPGWVVFPELPALPPELELALGR